MHVVSIDKQAVNQMPVVDFPGRIHIINDATQIERAVATLRQWDAVGFDTETRPCFKRGERHHIALLQLSTHSDAYLFRLNKTGVTPTLRHYLEDKRCTKVGLSITDDFHQIAGICNCQPEGFIELQQMVKRYQIADMSLQKIYAILFQQKISKKQQLTNWEATQLTESQQRYAAIDAWACLRIYEYLLSGAFIPEQSPYLHEVIEQEKQ